MKSKIFIINIILILILTNFFPIFVYAKETNNTTDVVPNEDSSEILMKIGI